MCSTKPNRPRWNTLYRFMLLFVLLLGLETRLHLGVVEHKLVLFLLVLIMYGAMAGWLRSNAEVMQQENQDVSPQRSPRREAYGTAEFQTATQVHYRAALPTQHPRHEF
jgi:hypothetical protein